MKRFTKGQKVVCVDASGDFPAARLLEEGKTYTVARRLEGVTRPDAVRVKDGRRIVGGPSQHWSRTRFRLAAVVRRHAKGAK